MPIILTWWQMHIKSYDKPLNRWWTLKTVVFSSLSAQNDNYKSHPSISDVKLFWHKCEETNLTIFDKEFKIIGADRGFIW